MTSALQPGMVVGVGFSLSGKIVKIEPIVNPVTLPPIQGFVRSVDLSSGLLRVKIRARPTLASVPVDASIIPTNHSTILLTPTVVDGDFGETGVFLKTLTQSELGHQTHEVLDPSSADHLMDILKVALIQCAAEPAQGPSKYIELQNQPELSRNRRGHHQNAFT